MQKIISCGAIGATLSKNRSDIDLSKFLGIAYTTTVGWGKKENYSSEKRFQRYLLEYFRRYDEVALEIIMEHYDLSNDNDADTIAEHFIPEKEVQALLVSKVEWKRKAIKMMLNVNRSLFIRQSEMIKMIVAADEKSSDIPVFLKGEKNSEFIPFDVVNADVEHLKKV